MKLLEAMPANGVTLAAADAVRAVAMNNNENKTAVRENWGIPLLVKLLCEDVRLHQHGVGMAVGQPGQAAVTPSWCLYHEQGQHCGRHAAQ